jgi:hypothetical protein
MDAASGREERHGVGEKFSGGGGRQHPFKGGRRDATEGGVGSRATRGAKRGRERGLGRGSKWLGRPASAPGWWARVAALPCYSGGRWDTRD